MPLATASAHFSCPLYDVSIFSSSSFDKNPNSKSVHGTLFNANTAKEPCSLYFMPLSFVYSASFNELSISFASSSPLSCLN